MALDIYSSLSFSLINANGDLGAGSTQGESEAGLGGGGGGGGGDGIGIGPGSAGFGGVSIGGAPSSIGIGPGSAGFDSGLGGGDGGGIGIGPTSAGYNEAISVQNELAKATAMVQSAFNQPQGQAGVLSPQDFQSIAQAQAGVGAPQGKAGILDNFSFGNALKGTIPGFMAGGVPGAIGGFGLGGFKQDIGNFFSGLFNPSASAQQPAAPGVQGSAPQTFNQRIFDPSGTPFFGGNGGDGQAMPGSFVNTSPTVPTSQAPAPFPQGVGSFIPQNFLFGGSPMTNALGPGLTSLNLIDFLNSQQQNQFFG